MYLENSILDIYSVVNFNNRVEDTLYRVSTPTDSGRVDFPHPAPYLMFELLFYKCYGISWVSLMDNILAAH